MKIAITADPFIPVPPQLYGGIERLIAALIRQYVAEGHEVSLFAHAASQTQACLFSYPSAGNGVIDVVKNTNLIRREMRRNKYDVLHSFGRMAYLIPQLPKNIIKIMSYQREPTITQIKRVYSIARKGSMFFTGCSNYISDQINPHAPCYTIYNCAGETTYQFAQNVSNDAPLVFLGRVEPIKGAHLAIKMAQKTGKKLVIAGNLPPEQQAYFNKDIKPHLSASITYVGPVNDVQKNELLGNALALVFPIQWNEPFGIVMAEAMACGTPILGIGRGAVPEVIRNGENGFYANTIDELIGYVSLLERISRNQVREIFEHNFSEQVIARAYLDLYQNLLTANTLR